MRMKTHPLRKGYTRQRDAVKVVRPNSFPRRDVGPWGETRGLLTLNCCSPAFSRRDAIALAGGKPVRLAPPPVRGQKMSPTLEGAQKLASLQDASSFFGLFRWCRSLRSLNHRLRLWQAFGLLLTGKLRSLGLTRPRANFCEEF